MSNRSIPLAQHLKRFARQQRDSYVARNLVAGESKEKDLRKSMYISAYVEAATAAAPPPPQEYRTSAVKSISHAAVVSSPAVDDSRLTFDSWRATKPSAHLLRQAFSEKVSSQGVLLPPRLALACRADISSTSVGPSLRELYRLATRSRDRRSPVVPRANLPYEILPRLQRQVEVVLRSKPLQVSEQRFLEVAASALWTSTKSRWEMGLVVLNASRTCAPAALRSSLLAVFYAAVARYHCCDPQEFPSLKRRASSFPPATLLVDAFRREPLPLSAMHTRNETNVALPGLLYCLGAARFTTWEDVLAAFAEHMSPAIPGASSHRKERHNLPPVVVSELLYALRKKRAPVKRVQCVVDLVTADGDENGGSVSAPVLCSNARALMKHPLVYSAYLCGAEWIHALEMWTVQIPFYQVPKTAELHAAVLGALLSAHQRSVASNVRTSMLTVLQHGLVSQDSKPGDSGVDDYHNHHRNYPLRAFLTLCHALWWDVIRSAEIAKSALPTIRQLQPQLMLYAVRCGSRVIAPPAVPTAAAHHANCFADHCHDLLRYLAALLREDCVPPLAIDAASTVVHQLLKKTQ